MIKKTKIFLNIIPIHYPSVNLCRIYNKLLFLGLIQSFMSLQFPNLLSSFHCFNFLFYIPITSFFLPRICFLLPSLFQTHLNQVSHLSTPSYITLYFLSFKNLKNFHFLIFQNFISSVNVLITPIKSITSF